MAYFTYLTVDSMVESTKKDETDTKLINLKAFFNVPALIKQISSYLPDFHKKLFLKAFYFAEDAHNGQFRKDGVTPYIVHPLSATKILADMHADEDILISAILHDVPEDTSHTIKEVQNLFGDKIAFFIEGITKLSKVHYQHNMPEREIESLKKLFLHSAKDLRIILIKLADRFHNMQTLEYVEKPEKRLRIAKETLEIYVPIANLLGVYYLKERLEDLCFKHLFPTEYLQINQKLETIYNKHKKDADLFVKIIDKDFKVNGIKAEISYLKRGLYRTYKKICAQGKSIDDIKNRITIEVIVDDTPKCYQALGIIHGHFIPKPDRFKDYIANPKINGYQSLHSVLFGVNGVSTEVQIRTRQMNIEAKYGIASHFFNKGEDKDTCWTSDKRSLWVTKILRFDNKKQYFPDFLENLKLDAFQDRIVVFTPKGFAVDLPKDATPIDFAYAIHTEVGNHAVQARINSKLQPLTVPIKTGDVITIITKKSSKPELFWLSFTKTNLAKNKILYHFKKISRAKRLEEGKKLLQKEFDLAGLGLISKLSFKNVKSVLTGGLENTCKNLDDVFISIGEGSLRAITIVKKMRSTRHLTPFMERLLTRWTDESMRKTIKVDMKILSNNRPGVMVDIAKILYKHVIDICYMKATVSLDLKRAMFKIQVIVDDMEKAGKIFDELEHFEDVQSVYSINNVGLIIFYTLALVTGCFWAIHPFVLQFFNQAGLINENHILANLTLIFGLVIMFSWLIYLNILVKKYFPLIRNKGLLWTSSLLIITGAISVIAAELFYYQFPFHFILTVLIIIVMYGYLGMSYFDYRKSRF